MQKIILDTNILVSALIARSAPAQILYECVLEEIVIVCLSNNILDEYQEILVRDKFTKLAGFRDKAAIVLSKLFSIVRWSTEAQITQRATQRRSHGLLYREVP
jgi:uncharacterized protein